MGFNWGFKGLNSLSSFTVCTFPLTLLILLLLLQSFYNSTYIASLTQLSLKPVQFHICCYPWVSFFWKAQMFGNVKKRMNVWNSEILLDTTAKHFVGYNRETFCWIQPRNILLDTTAKHFVGYNRETRTETACDVRTWLEWWGRDLAKMNRGKS